LEDYTDAISLHIIRELYHSFFHCWMNTVVA